jgi:retinol dehydrogenase-16
MDVTNQQSVRKAYEFVTSKLPAGTGLWGVLNNAGIAGRCGPPEWLSIKDYEQVLNVNLLGLIDVTMTFLPLVKQSRGRIVNTSSMLGRFTLDSCIPYCVSKYGIEAFTDGLRRTLRPYNCRAILIEPGFHQTNMISKSNINSLLEEAWNNASPEVKEEFGEEYFRQAYNRLADSYSFMTTHRVSDVVDAYEHALLSRHPRPRYVVGIDAWFLGIPGQSLPEWISDWLVNILDRSKSVPAILLNTTRQ